MQRNRLAPPAQSSTSVVRLLTGVGVLGLGILLWLVFGAGAATAAEQPTLNGRALSAAAGWHQRAVRRAVETTAPASQSRRAPAGWSAGAVQFGDGRALRDGSRRVKEVQRRLRALGYHPGPVNGVYGERTRDAVGWFQYKHQLTLDGIVTVSMLRHIRAAQADAPARPAQRTQGRADTGDAVAPRRAADAPAPETAAAATSGLAGLAWWLWGLIAAGALALAALVAAILHRRRDRPVADAAPVYELWVHGTSSDPAIGTFRGVVKAVSVPDEPRPAGWVADSQYLIHDPAKAQPFWAPAGQIDQLGAARQQNEKPDPDTAPRAVGYLPRVNRVPPGPTPSPEAGRIETACQERGWTLAQIVGDDPGEPGHPGLEQALARLASGQASRLVVARLAHVAHSAAELSNLIGRVDEYQGSLVICDIDLDTATTGGRRTANALAGLHAEPISDPVPTRTPAPAHR